MDGATWIDQAGNRLLLLRRGLGLSVWQMNDAEGRRSCIVELTVQQRLEVYGYLDLVGVGVLRTWADWDGDELRVLRRKQGVMVAVYSTTVDDGPLAPVELDEEQTRGLREYLATELRELLRGVETDG